MSTVIAWLGFIFIVGCLFDWMCGLSVRLRAVFRGISNPNINADVNLVVGTPDGPRGPSADPLTPTDRYMGQHQFIEHRALGKRGG